MKNKTANVVKEIKETPDMFQEAPQNVKYNQFKLPTWSIVVFLLLCFVVLKSFVYIKDEKRKED